MNSTRLKQATSTSTSTSFLTGFGRRSTTLALVVGGLSWGLGHGVVAQSIPVPNYSFESQTAPNSSPYVNIFIDSWEKAPEPAYFGPAIGTPFGIPWQGTAGVFYDTNPYQNAVGTQAGYLLGFPEVTLFQDSTSTAPGGGLDATYEVGLSYQLTLGVFGKSSLAPGSTLAVSLYYLDDSNNRVPVASTTVTYTPEGFPTAGPLNLVDYSVNVPTVEFGDAWAGRPIGIQLESTTPLESSTGGNWDFDNVRLTAVPEPGRWGLFVLGVGGLWWAGRARRK